MSDWIESEIEQQIGIPYAALLEPISSEVPEGDDLAHSEVYAQIQAARMSDDASLQMGEWQHELKRADWEKVVQLAGKSIAEQSKDLQLCAWLLEGLLQRHGFGGIATGVHLLGALCKMYWPTIYPKVQAGGVNRRANLFDWMNRKLQPSATLIQLTVPATQGLPSLTWSDHLMARRNERIRLSGMGLEEADGPTVDSCRRAIALAPTHELRQQWDLLERVRESFQMLQTSLRIASPEAHPPALPGLAGLLERIQAFFASELYARGINVPPAERGIETAASAIPTSASDAIGVRLSGEVASFRVPDAPFLAPPSAPAGTLSSTRHEAYETLSRIAEILERLEPHSPTPSLVRRAVEWGRLSTSELYRQIFVEAKGNLNILELLGIENDGAGNGQ